jgi:hypothetical protein
MSKLIVDGALTLFLVLVSISVEAQAKKTGPLMQTKGGKQPMLKLSLCVLNWRSRENLRTASSRPYIGLSG